MNRIITLVITIVYMMNGYAFFSDEDVLIRKFKGFDRVLANQMKKDFEMFESKKPGSYDHLKLSTEKFCKKAKELGYHWNDACRLYKSKLATHPVDDKNTALDNKKSQKIRRKRPMTGLQKMNLKLYKDNAKRAFKNKDFKELREACKYVYSYIPDEENCRKWEAEEESYFANKKMRDKERAIKRNAEKKEREKRLKLSKLVDAEIQKRKKMKSNSDECSIAYLQEKYCEKFKITMYYTTLLEEGRSLDPQVELNLRSRLSKAVEIQMKYTNSLKKMKSTTPDCDIQINRKYISFTSSNGVYVGKTAVEALKKATRAACYVSDSEINEINRKYK